MVRGGVLCCWSAALDVYKREIKKVGLSLSSPICHGCVKVRTSRHVRTLMSISGFLSFAIMTTLNVFP